MKGCCLSSPHQLKGRAPCTALLFDTMLFEPNLLFGPPRKSGRSPQRIGIEQLAA